MNFSSSNQSNPLFVPGLNKGPSVLNSSPHVRLGYLKKVYGILSIQLALTTVLTSIVVLSPSIQLFFISNIWLLMISAIGNIATTWLLLEKRNEYPTNFFLLGAFTVLNSISLGMIVAQYPAYIVAEAFLLTTVITLGLTVYTFTSKNDLTYIGSYLYSLLPVLLIGSLIHLFVGNSFTDTVLAVFGAILFAGYIIYDTNLIMKHLSAEEYIVGVLNLYLDIINLFIKLLKILKALNGEEKKEKKRRE